jgi:hypothetical protein
VSNLLRTGVAAIELFVASLALGALPLVALTADDAEDFSCAVASRVLRTTAAELAFDLS